MLRSETPAGGLQEIYGLLLGHVRHPQTHVRGGSRSRLLARELSFVATLKILRCRLPEVPRTFAGLQRWYRALIAEVSEERLAPRRNRINPRVIKRKMSNWAKKREKHRQFSQPTLEFRKSIVILD